MNHRGIPVGAASSNDNAPSTAMTDDQQAVVPSYPFVVVPSPSSLEVSSYDTSSGSPSSSRPSQGGVGSGPGAQSEWHLFLQQNNMTVNCLNYDPVVIENFIKFRERAVVEAARVTVAASQAQASAAIATSEAQSQARVEVAEQTINSVATEASAYVRGIEGAAREHAAMTEVAAQTRVNHVEQEAASRVGQAVAAAQGAMLSENSTRQQCETHVLQERNDAKLKQESLQAQVEKLQAVLEEMQNAQTDELREMQDQRESEIASLKREVPQTFTLTGESSTAEAQPSVSFRAPSSSVSPEPSHRLAEARGTQQLTAEGIQRIIDDSIKPLKAQLEKAHCWSEIKPRPTKSGKDSESESDTDSEEEPEDMVWLRAGQASAYPPKFLLSGEREGEMYSEKLLISALSATTFSLPRDASGLPDFVRSLCSLINPIDKSTEGVLSKPIHFYTRNHHKRELCASDPLQGGLPTYGKHIAAALTRPAVLATNPELAITIKRYQATAIDAGRSLMMGPILSAIGHHCSYRKEAATGQVHMSFLMLRPSSLSDRDVSAFVQTLEGRLAAVPAKRQPAPETLFSLLWNSAPHGCGFQEWRPLAQDVEKIREARKGSHKKDL